MANVLCPSCGGGRSKERSLHVFTNDAGRTCGVCYRASCGWSGAYDGDVPHAEPRKVETSREPLSSTHRQWLVGRVGAEPLSRLHAFSASSRGTSAAGSRIGLPVFSPLGVEAGYTLRAVERGVVPKYLTVLHSKPYNLGAWYQGTCTAAVEALKSKSFTARATVVLVEDQLSAAYLSTHTALTAVALLGHTIHQDLAVYLSKQTARAVLALDPDATRNAVKNYLSLRAILDIQLITIRDDLKNLPVEEMKDVFARLDWCSD